jgi:hypothetical protein
MGSLQAKPATGRQWPPGDGPWASLLTVVDEARDRHVERFGPILVELTGAVEMRYESEVTALVARHRRDRWLAAVLNPILDEAEAYLRWMRWMGWNAVNLLPPLGQDIHQATQRLALAMLVYCSTRLIDDGMDGHETYKGYRPTLLGRMRERLPDASPRLLAAFSVFLGARFVADALDRVTLTEHDLGRIVAVQFDHAALGALAEPLLKGAFDLQTYERVVRRKAAGYNLILYKPLVHGISEPLRGGLLAILSDLDSLAQILNDVADSEDDRRRLQPNALDLAAFGPSRFRAAIARRLGRLIRSIGMLPIEMGDAVAAMVSNLDLAAMSTDYSGRGINSKTATRSALSSSGSIRGQG